MTYPWRLTNLTLKTEQVGEHEEIVKEDLLYLSIVGSEASERRPLDRDEDATEPAWWHVGHIPLNELSSDLTLVVQTENEDDFGYAQLEADELEASYTTGEALTVHLATEVPGMWTLSTKVQKIATGMPLDFLDLDNGSEELEATKAEGDDKEQQKEKSEEEESEEDVTMLQLLMTARSHVQHALCSGDVERLNVAVAILEDVVDMVPDDDPALPEVLVELGEALSLRGHLVVDGAIDELRRAVTCFDSAVRRFPAEDEEGMVQKLQPMTFLLQELATRTGALDDIQSAIDEHQRLLGVAMNGQSMSLIHQTMDGLGACFVLKHGLTGHMSDLEQGIDLLETVIAMSEEGSEAYWNSSIHLGNALMARFQRNNRFEDLDRAVDLSRRASLALREGDTQSALAASNNLAIALFERYRHLSSIEDLEEAIAVQRRCVRDSANVSGLPGLPQRLTNLSSFLEQRYQHLGNLRDINEALQAQHHALELTADDDAILPNRLTNLAIAYDSLFNATKDPSALQTCIDYLKRSLVLIQEQHPLLPLILSNLGIALARQASQGDSAAFDEAVETFTQVTQTTPAGHRAEADRWNSLGTLWHARFRQTQDPYALSQASSAFERALQLTPEGHAASATRLSRMADIHASRYALFHNEADFQVAAEFWMRAVSSSTSSPDARFGSALCWAQLQRQRDPQESLVAWEAAVELVPMMVGLGETVKQRTKALAKISDVALKAASTAFSVDRPDKALQWLEQARCLIWNQLHVLQSPVEELRLHDSQLADRLRTLSGALHQAGFRNEDGFDAPVRTLDDTISLQDETRDHRRMAREWGELLSEIRQLPGLEYFLLPPSTSQLFEHLPSGPVVLINVSAERCDALALIPGMDEPMHIPLPLLSEEIVDDMASRLRIHLVSSSLLVRGGIALEADEAARAVRPTGARVRDKKKKTIVEDILRQLWTRAVKPILDALGFSPTDSPDSRIWWCTTGALSFLPIHAAGIYSGPDAVEGETTLSDFAVSSYTPTVTTLSNRVKQTAPSEALAPGLLLVSQPTAPGLPSIPLTSLEVKVIHELAERASIDATVLDGHDATLQNCVAEMRTSSCVHLACHGVQDQKNPLQSGFFLDDGLLKLSNIVQGDVKAADFAFLSACQTSTGDYRVPEEAIHLAAGMLAVGYTSVVGTMWSIGDEAAPKVSEEFYKYLFSINDPQSPTKLSTSQTAEALHHSTKILRKKMGTSDAAFLAWVPYVHFGL